MEYSFCATKDGITYSLDMIRLRVDISEYKLDKFFHEFIDDETNKLSKVSLMNTGERKWRHFATCTYANNGKIKMGFYLNGCPAERREQGFIEFNPNSFCDSPEFWQEYKWLMKYFPYPEIVRFDIAIDIPINRKSVAIVKDNRMYTCFRKSAADFTEHLGLRNTVGRVKLYNKEIESKLSYPLTRLEITADMKNLHIPQVIDLRNLPKSDEALIRAVLKNDYVTLALADISQFQRKKILNLIERNKILFSDECVEEVLEYANRLAPRKELM